MRRKAKQILSGMLSLFTLISAFAQPMEVFAAEMPETEAYEVEYPALDSVKDLLAEEEIVTAKDYSVEAGSSFDIERDFTDMEINLDKVKVTFYKAVDDEKHAFDINRTGTYEAVYFVEPFSGNPKYHIRRELTVTEAAPDAQAASGGDNDTANGAGDGGGTEVYPDVRPEPNPQIADAGDALSSMPEMEDPVIQPTESMEPVMEMTEQAEVPLQETEVMAPNIQQPFMPEENMQPLIPAPEQEETAGTELQIEDVMDQMQDQEIDIMALDYGESVSFFAVTAASEEEEVTVTKGTTYYYADYGYGSYETSKYTVKFGDVSAVSYCVQPASASPDSGTYTITKLKDSKALAKVCYYGTKASGDEGFFKEMHPDFSEGQKFIIVHLAASYANGSSDAFSGANELSRGLAMELYEYCMSQPEIPDVDMEFSDAKPKAYVEGDIQRTKEIKFKADELQSITMKLPAGVKFHNLTTGTTSKAGASVEVTGGTKFYLSAPLTQATDVAAKWSSTMKGSITKDYSAYKVTTGRDHQDLALVFGEGVAKEKFVDFSVTWLQEAGVEITKQDPVSGTGLAGCVYGLYTDKDCTNLLVQMPETDTNGKSSVKFTKTQDIVYLKEITAPAGYMVDTKAYDITLVVGETSKKTVTDTEQLGQLTVYKEGEVLSAAVSTEAGTLFQYEKRRQPGAVFNVYAGADIYAANGALVLRSGDLVMENLTTDGSGTAVLPGLHLGTYVIREMKAPNNFICKSEEKTVTLSYAGQTVEVVFSESTFVNERQKAAVSVMKVDKDTSNPLQGGIFGLYAGSDITNADGAVVVSNGALIEKAVSGTDGKAVFHSDIPIGFTYAVKEEQAPAGYLRNAEDVYTFQFGYTNGTEALVEFTHTFLDGLARAKISLQKKDAEKKEAVAQGDATLEKAVYGLYARSDIVHPDGRTGVIYHAGDKVTELVTAADGTASVDNLFLGDYFVKEITPPVGYLADGKEHDLICNSEGDLTAVVERDCVSEEEVKKQPFQIIKAVNNGNTDAELLAGAGFSAYLVSSLNVLADGTYDFTTAKPVVIGESGATEIFTDEKGYACSIPIPYGTYIVRETTTPHNYTPVNDFIVRITEHMPDKPQTWRVLLDDEFEAKLKIVKADDETKQPVLVKNTEFKIYDVDNGEYVKQVTTYPTTVVHESFFTDEQGYLILPESLKIGNYRIEEVSAPYGYTLNQNYFNVKVDSNTVYQMDSVSEDAVITVTYENHPVKGELRIVKKGEVLDGYKKDFAYVVEPLAGAVFEVYAAENIYTADCQKDGDGNRLLEYTSGTLVRTVTTDADGEASIDDLPLGTYKVVEVKAPEGYVLNGMPQTVTFFYADQDTPVIEQTAEFENERQKVEISAVKKDAKTDVAVAGAVFGLYAKENILAHGEVVVKADTELAEAETGEDGKAVFEVDVPFGMYYIKEKEAPAGYVSSDVVLDITASYQEQDVQVIPISAEFKNEPTSVSFRKSDLTTGVELAGATLTVLDKDGEVVDTWTSVKGEEHIIERLTVGETYTLQEDMAPYWYLLSEKVKFTVADTADIQKVEMKDDVPKGLLLINKKGEFLDDVSILDNVGGWIMHLFSYFSGALQDVTFDVYALEDIKAADGESADYYKKDELVSTITTNDRGYAELAELPLGKYYVKEKETAAGYVLDGDAREIDLTYRDQETAVVTYSSDWQNNRQKVSVSVLKKEKDSERALEGAVFALCAKEDITNASGKVILEADTVIEERRTNREGKLEFEADLPIGFTYYVKETVPAPGFVTCTEAQEFTFQYEGQEKEVVPYEFTFEDQPTMFEFTKTALTDGKEVEGAKLQVTDEKRNVIDEWVSTLEPHVIRELVVGKTYTMTEILPAAGFVTAESVEFTVSDTAEVQKVEMKDDVSKAEFSKQDIAGNELPGARLMILDKDGQEVESWVSEDKPHYVEMLPIGEYILHEESAPDGYLVSEDVQFEVQDTGEIQRVEMKDDHTKVEISKQDIAGNELPGAKLTILDKDGKEVESWVSEDKPHYIELLPIGEYILREDMAPDGFIVSEEVPFRVLATGEIQKVEMKDDHTKVEISKQDIAGNELPGAKLTILDKDGKEVESWVSEEKPHYIEKLPIGEYTLREETAPDGYLLAENVKFEVKPTGEVQKVIMVDKAIQPVIDSGAGDTPAPMAEIPQTGDSRHLAFWLMFGILAACGVTVSMILLCKKKRN